jgi:hypothetical protein
MFITFLNYKAETCLQVITIQDRLNMLEEADKKNNELLQKCKARKDEIHKWSQNQTHRQKYSLLESHAHQQATHLLHRAFEIKQDQEDEVSTLYETRDRGHNKRHQFKANFHVTL